MDQKHCRTILFFGGPKSRLKLPPFKKFCCQTQHKPLFLPLEWNGDYMAKPSSKIPFKKPIEYSLFGP